MMTSKSLFEMRSDPAHVPRCSQKRLMNVCFIVCNIVVLCWLTLSLTSKRSNFALEDRYEEEIKALEKKKRAFAKRIVQRLPGDLA
mmetsp:Transcript_50497/g.132569  ORF Transcript_50497/g.132569 Transcript_50497/m.132569 type:complete len:86 (-) Transcript_50497:633-890(-)